MGLGDLRNLMKQAQRIQTEMQERQRKLGEARVEATSGGGMVRAVVTGHGELVELAISPEVATPSEVDMLADLVVAAVREAQAKAKDIAQKAMADLAGLLPPGFTP
ncbi:MAG: YbaB/EbfC family nucleoid-associated protein [Candidatus Acetothermia bacterium]|jgi:DNA-binding YbaB/EbfC family protein|nr:YbaB/EbfC family nucleoid-associated protein [Candidatus Acetothermia bacterium]